VLGWLSGLPLRTSVRATRLDHEPRAFGAGQLLAGRAVDAVLWVASFGPQTAPPLDAIGDLPLVVLGHPALGESLAARAAPTVFVPVATPGIGSAAHLFRVDGVVMLPLPAVVDDGLPPVAAVAQRLAALLQETR
jgi:formylmethanofuran dehydrogenase subunit B